MNIEIRERVYEALVRFHPNGQVDAHVLSLREVVDADTGKAIAPAEAKPPRPADIESVKTLLGEQVGTLIVAVSQQDAQIASLEDTVSSQARRIAELDAAASA